MAARWIRDGYVEPIDKKNVPNAKNLVDNLASINWDPERKYSLPWQSGMTGIGYNSEKTGRKLKNVADLFDPKFKGRVTMLSEPHDSAGMVLLGDGQRPRRRRSTTCSARSRRSTRQQGAARSGGSPATTTRATSPRETCGSSMACSGDIVQLQGDNPELQFALPRGGHVAVQRQHDDPAKVAHPYAAETMMNYVYDPEVAAKIAAYVNYVPPVKGAKEVLEKTDPEIANNPLIFPAPEIQAKIHPYPNLSPADEREMHEAMAKVTGA